MAKKRKSRPAKGRQAQSAKHDAALRRPWWLYGSIALALASLASVIAIVALRGGGDGSPGAPTV